MSDFDKQQKLREIGLKIRFLRESKKISRAQMAFEMDTTEKQITRIEYGQINTGLYSLIQIASILEVSPSCFFQE